MAEWSKALDLGSSPQGRGFKSLRQQSFLGHLFPQTAPGLTSNLSASQLHTAACLAPVMCVCLCLTPACGLGIRAARCSGVPYRGRQPRGSCDVINSSAPCPQTLTSAISTGHHGHQKGGYLGPCTLASKLAERPSRAVDSPQGPKGWTAQIGCCICPPLLSCAGHHGHQQGRHLGPCAAAAGAAGPQDRVPHARPETEAPRVPGAQSVCTIYTHMHQQLNLISGSLETWGQC